MTPPHPRWDPQPATLAAAPLRFNAPDWDGRGLVVELRVPDDDEVSWLVWQAPDRIALISQAPPDTLPGAVRAIAADTLREFVYTGRDARAAWETILLRTLHTTPRELELPELLASIRERWQ